MSEMPPADDDGHGEHDDIALVGHLGIPSRRAFMLAFVAVVLGGALGGFVGYGIVDTGCTGDCGTARVAGLLVSAVLAAVGTGIVAVIVLRSVSHWRTHWPDRGPRLRTGVGQPPRVRRRKPSA